jgi:hypothetical protein
MELNGYLLMKFRRYLRRYLLKYGVQLEILKNYGLKFVLFGDFYQLPSVESQHHDVINSEVFSEICDGQM